MCVILFIWFGCVCEMGVACDSAGFDGYFPKAESGAERGLQEEEVFAPWPTSQKDPRHSETPYQTPGLNSVLCFFFFFLLINLRCNLNFLSILSL